LKAAKHPKIGKSSRYQPAREGGIPARKYGRVWRFDQEEPDSWMKQGPSASEDNEPDRPESK
jgi:hypothetical protein